MVVLAVSFVQVWDSGFEIDEDKRQTLFRRPEVDVRHQMGGAGIMVTLSTSN